MAARRSKPTSTRTRKGRGSPSPRDDGSSASRTGSRLAWVGSALSAVLIVGVLTAMVLGPMVLHDRASRRVRERSMLVMFSWPVAPGETRTWLAESARNDLLIRAYDALDAEPDVLSAAQLEAVARAIRATGWFKGQPLVRRSAAGVIEVSGDWRVPAVVVRKGGHEHLIAWTGELLPMRWGVGESRLRAIEGVMFDPPSDDAGRLRYGEPWPGEDVRAALELFALLRGERFWEQVRDIEVSPARGGGRVSLSIVTDRGTRIIWGHRPGAAGVERGEPPTDIKLANLRELQTRFGRIDADRSTVAINTYNVVVPPRTELTRTGTN